MLTIVMVPVSFSCVYYFKVSCLGRSLLWCDKILVAVTYTVTNVRQWVRIMPNELPYVYQYGFSDSKAVIPTSVANQSLCLTTQKMLLPLPSQLPICLIIVLKTIFK